MVKVALSAHGLPLPPLAGVKTQICRLGLENAAGVMLKFTCRFNRCPAAHRLPGQADGASRVNSPETDDPEAGVLLMVETENTRNMARNIPEACFKVNIFITVENLTFECPVSPFENGYRYQINSIISLTPKRLFVLVLETDSLGA